MLVLGFDDYRSQGEALAGALGLSYAQVDIHRFPDGESKVTLPRELPEKVILCRSLDHPNNKLIELLLAATTARQQGARHLTLVAPYLCYMRQDIAFHPGEAVSQQIIGRFLAELFERVITVDPHLHRIERLEQAIPGREALALSSAEPMGNFLSENTRAPLLVGPDAESEQWVRAIAEPAGLEYAVATKERLGDREVKIKLPEHDYSRHEVILVDDMISTGRTLITVAKQLKQQGAHTLHCLVTHALFPDEVTAALHQAGIDNIWSSDSIPHPSNAISLSALLAEAVTGSKLKVPR
ncbi:MAG: ribose-phosphate diphosphokinase [Gammaproteobacteria bacterium]|nr:ribose-phosphate diphosphokinase [Gammaproteobacteria bacterium]